MNTSCRKKHLTFGEFIMAVYDTCGGKNAEEIVQFAVNVNLVEFRGRNRFVILEPGLDSLWVASAQPNLSSL
jgi:hypothetical protein